MTSLVEQCHATPTADFANSYYIHSTMHIISASTTPLASVTVIRQELPGADCGCVVKAAASRCQGECD